jgi:hypothetical protein
MLGSHPTWQGSGVLSICLIGEVGTEGPVGHDRGVDDAEPVRAVDRSRRIDHRAVVGPWPQRVAQAWGLESWRRGGIGRAQPHGAARVAPEPGRSSASYR